MRETIGALMLLAPFLIAPALFVWGRDVKTLMIVLGLVIWMVIGAYLLMER